MDEGFMSTAAAELISQNMICAGEEHEVRSVSVCQSHDRTPRLQSTETHLVPRKVSILKDLKW